MALFSKTYEATHLSSITASRNATRKLIRKASKGKFHAFSQLSVQYLDFLSGYFYTIGYVDIEQRSEEIIKLLVKCWRYLPYTKRVSDFERFIYTQLEKAPPLTKSSNLPQLEKLLQLDHLNRFLLVSRFFEKWSYKALCLSTRVEKRDLPNVLMHLKSKLIGFRPNMLKTDEKARVTLVSELLEGRLTKKETHLIEKEITSEYHSLQFKADWLEYRCELVELNQTIKLSEITTSQIIERLSHNVRQHQMEKPKLIINLANHISFKRIPAEAYL